MQTKLCQLNASLTFGNEFTQNVLVGLGQANLQKLAYEEVCLCHSLQILLLAVSLHGACKIRLCQLTANPQFW
jgi:hypothetical protein